MIDVQAASEGSPCLSMPATANRSPWEHHWASTSEEQRGIKSIYGKLLIVIDTNTDMLFRGQMGIFTFQPRANNSRREIIIVVHQANISG